MGRPLRIKNLVLLQGVARVAETVFFFKVRDKESGRKHEVVVRQGFLLYS